MGAGSHVVRAAVPTAQRPAPPLEVLESVGGLFLTPEPKYDTMVLSAPEGANIKFPQHVWRSWKSSVKLALSFCWCWRLPRGVFDVTLMLADRLASRIESQFGKQSLWSACIRHEVTWQRPSTLASSVRPSVRLVICPSVCLSVCSPIMIFSAQIPALDLPFSGPVGSGLCEWGGLLLFVTQ